MKYAMTMDGKIAAYTGESKWVTGEAARIHDTGTATEIYRNYGRGGNCAGR